jgi:hypothetical protein
MGKFFVRFSQQMFPNGVDFKIMQQAIGALPGETIVTYFGRSVIAPTQHYLLDATNVQFEDGTEIVANFHDNTISPPGKPSYIVTTFDGVNIIDPQSWNQPSTGNGQITIPSPSYSVPSPSGPGGQYGYQVVNIYGGGGSKPGKFYSVSSGGSGAWPTDPNKVPPSGPPSSKCICGADSVGGGHSGWCNKA